MNADEATLRMPADDRPHEQPREPERPHAATAAGIFGDLRHRDPAPFRKRAQHGYAPGLRARRFVGTALHDARLGRAVDAQGARELVEELVMTARAGAAPRLTNDGEGHEYTAIHCVNVCVLALAFGAHLGLDNHDLVRLGVGALLHDIGKTRTPGAILQKAGELTPDELAIVKRHPEDGYQLMARSPRMPREALEVIRLHHERLGGQGYPFGLSGDQIPRHVRIAAIADAYDTMTSDRPYSRARPAAEAIEALQEQADTHFGAGLVREFIRGVSAVPTGDPHDTGTERDRGDGVTARRIRRALVPATTDPRLLQGVG